MRALRFTPDAEPRVRLVRDAPEPRATAGLARIRPLRAAISSRDALALAGGSPFARRGEAVTLGSEFVGRVEEASPGSEADERRLELLAGKRVVADPSTACGACDLCTRGLPQHCRNRRELGAVGLDGALADALALPIACLHPVPDSVDDDTALFATGVAAAQHARAQLHLKGKTYITVLGDSAEGLLCAQLMARANASVRLVGEHPERLEICAKWSVRHRPLADIGRNADQDIVVDCTGTEDGLATALRLARPRGQVLLRAPSTLGSTPTESLALIAERELQVIGSREGPIPEAMRALENGEVDVASLISRRMKLDDAEAALKLAHADPATVKALIDP
jgi:alcohol dehydrogenase